MPGKQKVPMPIDRPLSRAYLRGFTGWSTAYPPGQSDPTTLRHMDNMLVDRNGALSVRPGMRYLSYRKSPDMNSLVEGELGLPCDRQLVGTQEPFYTSDGSKALLFGVRETDGTVGFRAILFRGAITVVHRLTDPEIGFQIPQGESVLNFSKATTHVEYLQINNRIIALSDAGEAIRMFFVGGEKVAKKLNTINVPNFEDNNKLSVVHPAESWISKRSYTARYNSLRNPSFELGADYWTPSAQCAVAPGGSPLIEGRSLELRSLPTRTNMQTSPLHNVSVTGIEGWHSHKTWGNPKIGKDGDWLKISDSKGKGLFLAYGAKLYKGVVAGEKYQVALDYAYGPDVTPVVVLTFYNAAGAKIGTSTSLEMPRSSARYVSKGITAPLGTTSMRVSIGGRNTDGGATYIKAKNVMLCKESEVTTMFHGGSGTNYFWDGPENASPSVYHPPVDISITSSRSSVPSGTGLTASIHAIGVGAGTVTLRTFDKDNKPLPTYTGQGALTGSWSRPAASVAVSHGSAVNADMVFSVAGVARGTVIRVDAAMLEPYAAAAGAYFDGNTSPAGKTTYGWDDRSAPHSSTSWERTSVELPKIPPPNTAPTAKTLIATGGPTANTYKMGFFYTFENEVGESAASRITEVRMMRPWSNWIWETPNPAGEPSGTYTDKDTLCADQLAAIIPKTVFDQAIAEGAIGWNLYVFAWSDQEPVPVVGILSGHKDLYPDEIATLRTPAISYEDGGWISITPARRIGLNDAILPTLANRVNYSKPPRGRNGLVAGDRIILLGDPAQLATIMWSSNRPGEYTNFTASRGGGAKTLTTGNLNIPAAVTLWQNPQSVDTLAVLCMGADGQSTSYYMSPAQVSAQSSGTVAVMGFEETTSTPGTMSPYAVEVQNNALYRPIDRALLKSTAQNYNINHKTMSDKIQNMWIGLRSKQWVMSAVLDNRLYYLVHNPRGELLEPGMKGNEIWVLDLGIESNPWSRFTIQGSALRPFDVGSRTYMGVTRPEGLYYLDHDYRADDFVDDRGYVRSRPIEWSMETNTQGANRAHDAWAHLQQVSVYLGNFMGSLDYGVRGYDLNGRVVEMTKRFTDDVPVEDTRLTWDVEDFLAIRRDMKEWYFFARSVPGKNGTGQIGLVQYRYTPVSVNVGYEFGSVETFEYGSNVQAGNDDLMANGIPRTYVDYTRP